MAYEVNMPKLGLTMTEGLISAWRKQEGDAVSAGDVLFEVETDKLTTEVRSEYAGVLLKVLEHAGSTVECGKPIVYIGQAGEKNESPAPGTLASPLAKRLAAQKGYPIGEITGTGPGGRVVERDVLAHDGYKKKLSPAAARLAAEPGSAVPDITGRRIMKADILREPAAGVSSRRMTIARRMTESWHISPRVTYTMPVDASQMKELRLRLGGANSKGSALN